MDPQIQELSERARLAVDRQDWGLVDQCAEAIIGRDPGYAEGYFLRGLVHKLANRPVRAKDAFERALELNPARYDAAVELANQHCIARRNGLAADLLQQYQELMWNSPRYLDMAGTIYSQIGLPERAWPFYVRANELQAGVDLFVGNLAACAVYLGKISDAKEAYQQLLVRHPAHQRNHYHLSRLEPARDREHIEQMEGVLASSNLPPAKNVFLYYALGKEYEDLKCWDKAFEYYQKGGRAILSVANYEPSAELALLEKIESVCDEAWIQQPLQRTSSKSNAKRPIFIVGLPRTGTTLTERILSSHSQVASVGETTFIQMALRSMSGIASIEPMNSEMISALADCDIEQLATRYLDSVDYRLGDETAFIDKLPFNFQYLGFIARAFPEAGIIHLRRNPLDACFAMYKQVFTFAYKFSYSLEHLGRYYIAYEHMRQHWKRVLGDRLIEINYEDLVSDQEEQTRSLLERLGLDFEPACLNFEKNAAPSATASSVQVREKIHNRSVARWKHFEAHLEPLVQQLKQAGIAID